VDETTWYEGSYRAYLWGAATPQMTVYWIRLGRAQPDFQAMFADGSEGVWVSDRHGAYNRVPAEQCQLCWAHLKRNFQAWCERGGRCRELGQALLSETQAVFALWHRFQRGELDRGDLQVELAPVQGRVHRLLHAGLDPPTTEELCGALFKWEVSLWTFSRVGGVEPTNNRAERALRRGVLWRKTSYGTQSERGSRFVERILTVVESLRLQGRSVLDYLEAVVRCQIAGLPVPSLLPDTS